MKILENISLSEFTTFKIGGPARYFCVVTSVDELKEAVDFAKNFGAHQKGKKEGKKIDEMLPMFILGGGSNILVSDGGFPGLVIKMEIKGIKVAAETGTVEVIAGAGENWDGLVAFTVEHGLGGLENLSLIPGSVGAAPVQNIGAYGAEVKDVISSVEVFDLETARLREMTNAECQFSYRDSIFKKPEGKKYVITRVKFRLSKNAALRTDYKDVSEYIKKQDISAKSLTIKKVRDIVISIRTAKLPDVRENAQPKIGTAGSFFKNPIVPATKYEELKKQYPDTPRFPVESQEQEKSSKNAQEKVKIPAAWLLDKLCGFKGYHEGSIGVYKNQALVLVNFGGGTATDILSLAQKMTDCVRQKTGILLEREVQVVG